MRYLLVILSLLLSVSAAFAQSEPKATTNTLPGEESLSLRERAERDFLMPVRRKKVVVEPTKTIGEEVTAAPENDITAHVAAAADEIVRTEEAAAPARESHVARTTHTSRSSHTKHRSTSHKSSHRSHSSSHKSTKKSTAKKKTATHKRRR